MLTLYYFKGTIAAAVAIALKDVGVEFKGVLVDFKNAEQRGPSYGAVNPKGRVPALVTPQGTLTETLAILCYLGDAYPQADLCPDDPFEAAQMRGVMTYLASTVHVNHAHKMRGERWADKPESWDDMRNKVSQTMTECAAYIEDHCIKGEYVMGDRYTAADPYLFVVSTWFEGDGVDLAAFPKLAQFHQRMLARPSVQAAQADGYL